MAKNQTIVAEKVSIRRVGAATGLLVLISGIVGLVLTFIFIAR